jgi:hypothetical protein
VTLEGWERPPAEPAPWSAAWLKWTVAWIVREYRAGIEAASPMSQSQPHGASRNLLAVLVIAGFLPVALGFVLHLHEFIAHVLAGASGLILGAVLAVWLIDSLLARRRSEHWHAVRVQMLSLACERIVEMASDYAAAIPGEHGFIDRVGPEDNPMAKPEIATALTELLDATAVAASELALDVENPNRASTRLLYDQIKLRIAPLQESMTTRVIALGDEPHLVVHTLALERAHQNWHNWLGEVERAGAPDRYAWEQATMTLKAASELYAYILQCQ